MSVPAGVLPVLLAAVLLVAGVASIRHRADTRGALGRRLVLTGGFFLVVVRAAKKGETSECGCFGALLMP